VKPSIVVGALVALFAAASNASTLSFTGAELYNDPNVSFPTTTPTLNGTSLVFGPGTLDREISIRQSRSNVPACASVPVRLIGFCALP
jgi:hypothetical protein